MSRRWRLARNIGLALAALLVVIAAAAIVVTRTAWFRDFVKA